MSEKSPRFIGALMYAPLAAFASSANAQTAGQGVSSLPPVTITAPEQARRRPEWAERPAPLRNARRVSPRGETDSKPSAALPLSAALTAGRGDISSSVSALPAATTVIDAPMIARAPIATYGDLFRSLPGFNVSNFGQGAIASGLSLRGYTEAEHGRDIAYFIDGVPVNEVSSLHTPNYADLNILLPESVKKIEVVRGPFSVEAGDSNLGGAVYITTKDAEPFGSVGVSGGTQGQEKNTWRGVATYSTTQGTWLPYLALEGYRTEGYRDNAFIERYNAFNKITTRLPDGAIVSIRAQAYGTQFGAPGYASREAVRAGLIPERSAHQPD